MSRDIFRFTVNFSFMFYLPNKITVFVLLQRRKEAMESLESTMSSTSAEPKPKHRRKATKLPSRSSTPQPSQDEPMQAVEAMDVSGPVEVSEVGSLCLPVTEPAEQCASCCAFMNERRMLNNSVLDLRTKLNDKREELKRVKNKLKLKGRSYSVAAFVDKDQDMLVYSIQ